MPTWAIFSSASQLAPAAWPKAPSRFTTCTQAAPAACQRRAVAAGSSPYTVARARSPWARRTTWPFRRSMAGYNVKEIIRLRLADIDGDTKRSQLRTAIMTCEPRGSTARHKIPEQRQPHTLALFRVELNAVYPALPDDGRVVESVIGGRQRVFRMRRAVIRVVEIGKRPGGQVLE